MTSRNPEVGEWPIPLLEMLGYQQMPFAGNLFSLPFRERILSPAC